MFCLQLNIKILGQNLCSRQVETNSRLAHDGNISPNTIRLRIVCTASEVHRDILFKLSLSSLPLAFSLCILWMVINKSQAVGTSTWSFFQEFFSKAVPPWVLLFHYTEKHLTSSSVFIFTEKLLQGLWVTLPVFNGGIIVFVELQTRVGPPKKLQSSFYIFFWLVCTWTSLWTSTMDVFLFSVLRTICSTLALFTPFIAALSLSIPQHNKLPAN